MFTDEFGALNKVFVNSENDRWRNNEQVLQRIERVHLLVRQGTFAFEYVKPVPI